MRQVWDLWNVSMHILRIRRGWGYVKDEEGGRVVIGARNVGCCIYLVLEGATMCGANIYIYIYICMVLIYIYICI